MRQQNSSWLIISEIVSEKYDVSKAVHDNFWDGYHFEK
jgi:hypothetical protein